MLAATVSAAPATVAAQGMPAWPDSFEARLEALALIQTLNGTILASPSATRSLEEWCRDHALAPEPRIIARRVDPAAKPISPEQRRRLQIDDQEPVKFRRVQLRCGDRVLSEADNWYVPGRLTPEMNTALETTEAPFGKVVRPLGPWRRTVAAVMLWSPLPEGWPAGRLPAAATGPLEIPQALFEHRAVLSTSDNLPFSEVVETYQRQILAFPCVVSGCPAR
ncbi:MAG: hypothetical protein GC191_17285 [Azospirillum sp.]|nr:hypothetical protein [Azospirillum sp.]